MHVRKKLCGAGLSHSGGRAAAAPRLPRADRAGIRPGHRAAAAVQRCGVAGGGRTAIEIGVGVQNAHSCGEHILFEDIALTTELLLKLLTE